MNAGASVLMAVVLVAFTACGQDRAAAAREGRPLTCETFYRSSVTRPLDDGPVLTLDRHGQTEEAAFDDLTVVAIHLDDEFEQRSLSISVREDGREDPLVNHLYQMEHGTSPANTFSTTGQGFTGLIYAYSSSGSEVQLFCSAG